jgi:hypothetical protein
MNMLLQEIAGQHKKTNEHVVLLWNLNGEMQLQLGAVQRAGKQEQQEQNNPKTGDVQKIAGI